MTKPSQISAGSTLGMIAGGQIGGFFSEAALRMGYKVAVWDPDINAPAKRFASEPFTGEFDDKRVFNAFKEIVSGVSVEWENVPNSLIKELEKTVIVKPGSKSLTLAQDRIKEKSFLTSNGFPLTEYVAIQRIDEINGVPFDFPWIIKTATLGYDGHGQWYIKNMTEITGNSALQDSKVPMVVEKVVDYQIEVSVVVAMDDDGKVIAYPPTENLHKGGILKMSISPARIPDEIQSRVIELGCSIIRSIGDPGVFCIEMFLEKNGNLLINEIAPRPHNSGHHTIDAFSVSQYENQVRVLTGLPLREPIMLCESVLLNVLGHEYDALMNNSAINQILSSLNAKIYSYGKTSIRPGRKMGHIVFCGASLDELIRQAESCQDIMDRNLSSG